MHATRPSMAYHELIELERCAEGRGTFVALEGRELAVYRLADPPRVIVVDNACPHASGNLSGGDVSGSIVTCPWHHWRFDLDTGVCTDSARARVRRYPSAVRDGVVYADLAADP